MGIQRYIFFSIHNAEKHPEVPLMQVKTCTEKFVQQSGLNYTVFRLCGFMQACLSFMDSSTEHMPQQLHGLPQILPVGIDSVS